VQLPAVGAPDDPLAVQLAVHLDGQWRRHAQPVGPRLPERVVRLPAAQGAGAVPRGERHRLVVQEQDSEFAGRPLRQLPVLVLQGAGNPQLAAVEPDHLGALMQVAAVACPRAAQFDGGDVSQRGDPVLHRRSHISA